MPPRYAYWTILAGGLPTAFRAAEKDDLLPTFHRLKAKHADAEMRWFAHGKLWASPEEARRAAQSPRRDAVRRGPGWRPGGDHRDPRQQFDDARKARNQERRQERWDRQHGGRDAHGPPDRGRAGTWQRASPTKPHGDKLAAAGRRPSSSPRSLTPRSDHGAQRRDRPQSQAGRARSAGAPRPKRPLVRGHEQEVPPPPRPAPDREPRPGAEIPPEPPPRPSEPAIKPPGPPERGRRRK